MNFKLQVNLLTEAWKYTLFREDSVVTPLSHVEDRKKNLCSKGAVFLADKVQNNPELIKLH